jgi:hypothetical protein
MSMWSETIPVAEAAERLLAFIKEIRQTDDEFEQLMRRKAAIYRGPGTAVASEWPCNPVTVSVADGSRSAYGPCST